MLKEKRMRTVDPSEQQFNAGPRVWALVPCKKDPKKMFPAQSHFGSWYGVVGKWAAAWLPDSRGIWYRDIRDVNNLEASYLKIKSRWHTEHNCIKVGQPDMIVLTGIQVAMMNSFVPSLLCHLNAVAKRRGKDPLSSIQVQMDGVSQNQLNARLSQ